MTERRCWLDRDRSEPAAPQDRRFSDYGTCLIGLSEWSMMVVHGLVRNSAF